ncbi:MAG: anaerobic ribonucleoside-triphosphate reductase activating protein [Ruminococcus sp.]|jgi:anaerobic ribonucleoside-triphosphate reductase activating protein|nr:anaerobic ribonucleoside-triphosphate reductase activating protein [Ruminococcus sp.]
MFTLRLFGVKNDSIVDGDGIRYTIFTQGCPHKCDGCHNPESWDMLGGYDEDIRRLYDEITANPLLDGVTFSGGEPFLQAKALSLLGAMIKEETDLNIITYTGFTFKELEKMADDGNKFRDLIDISDIIIDGRFEKDRADTGLAFRGSSNQNVIRLASSQ